MRLTPPNLRDSNRNNGGLQMIGKSGCRVLREQCRVLEMAGWSRRTKWGQQLPNDRCLARLAGGVSSGHRTPVMGSLQEVLYVRPRHIGLSPPGRQRRLFETLDPLSNCLGLLVIQPRDALVMRCLTS